MNDRLSTPKLLSKTIGAMLMLLVGILLLTPAVLAQEGETVQPNGSLPGNPEIQLVKVVDGLADPLDVNSPPGDDRLFIVERPGFIRILDADGTLLEDNFLDISDVVKTDFLEQGLLGLAFHPNYAENGRFFIYYTDWRTNGDVVLAEGSVSDDPNLADPESLQVLLTLDQPYVNHNGGHIRFGPDGYLYVGTGDGGLAGDPYDNGQDMSNLWGKLLRLDVDSTAGNGYAIPEDNPFNGDVLYSPQANSLATAENYHPDAAPEIWAYGLRNPWQFSFDAATGDLYIADVGQNMYEEINFEPADSMGGNNYGWDLMEGAHAYPPGEDTPSLSIGVLPVAEYAHEEGGCSITGLGVYRGAEYPALDGIYFSSDYCSGRVWGLIRDENDAWQYAELLDTDLLVSGAGSDGDNNVYVTSCACEFSRDYNPTETLGGAVWRIVQADMTPEDAETAPVDSE